MEWEIRRSTLLPELRSASLGYDTKLTPGWIAQRTVARLDGKADPVDATFKTMMAEILAILENGAPQ